VNRDCTGIVDAVGTGLHSFVIIDGGKQMDLMDNNSAEVLTIHFTTIGQERTITTETECGWQPLSDGTWVLMRL
jgi:hypothetical protein